MPRRRTRILFRSLWACTLLAAICGIAVPASGRTPPSRVAIVADAPGSVSALAGYRIQSSAKVTDSGAAVSTPGYAASGWYPVGPRSTVLAGLLENNVYSDPFFSTNMQSIPTADFDVPWWYRSDFTLGSETGLRTFLDFSGVMSSADVWVNGSQGATAAQVAGAYTRHERDVTALVHPGANSVAFRVNANNP